MRRPVLFVLIILSAAGYILSAVVLLELTTESPEPSRWPAPLNSWKTTPETLPDRTCMSLRELAQYILRTGKDVEFWNGDYALVSWISPKQTAFGIVPWKTTQFFERHGRAWCLKSAEQGA